MLQEVRQRRGQSLYRPDKLQKYRKCNCNPKRFFGTPSAAENDVEIVHRRIAVFAFYGSPSAQLGSPGMFCRHPAAERSRVGCFLLHVAEAI